jgi:hypothetical protein
VNGDAKPALGRSAIRKKKEIGYLFLEACADLIEMGTKLSSTLGLVTPTQIIYTFFQYSVGNTRISLNLVLSSQN